MKKPTARTVSLQNAASKGNVEQMKKLISLGANVNEKDKNNCTPLHCAVMNGHKEAAELLIAKGANVNLQGTYRKQTPLHCAAQEGNKNMAELLIAHGAYVNLKDKSNRTPLDIALRIHKLDIVELLIAHCDDVNLISGRYRWLYREVEKDSKYIIIDNFEDYNDYVPDRIVDTWIDGWSDVFNGSVIGYPDPVFAAGEHFIETTTVHSGKQSMPFLYDNQYGNSEATTIMILSSLSDWNWKGISKLSLWYIGDEANDAEKMYVTLNGTATVFNENINAARVTRWTQWSINMQEFLEKGANLTNIYIITIGFGDNPPAPGGKGLVFFDDICFYRTPQPELETVDPGTESHDQSATN
jgi:hypothetical protein